MSRDRITRLIGVDCAVDPRKTGLAIGRLESLRAANQKAPRLVVEHAELGVSIDALVDTVSQAVHDSERTLLALDAPLGWPSALGTALAPHRAGESISASAQELFLRQTDLFVRRVSGKRPLEVGADRIARTARSALGLVDAVRSASRKALAMAWSPEFDESGLIEVYPAATLLARGLPSSRYKRPDQRDVREQILAGLAGELEFDSVQREHFCSHADVLDAAICLVAGADFLRGRCLPPTDRALAREEGWIWIPDLFG
jgi:hypothetical protein